MDAVPRSFVWGGFTLALNILVGPSMTDACLAIPSLRAGKKHLVEAGECSRSTMEAKFSARLSERIMALSRPGFVMSYRQPLQVPSQCGAETNRARQDVAKVS